jgi:hypothetical protein
MAGGFGLAQSSNWFANYTIPHAGAVSLKGAVNSVVNRPKKNPPVRAGNSLE